MYEKIKPLYDRVLVRRMELENKTPAGIILPDASKEKAQTGKIVATGSGRITSEGNIVPMQVKVGDIIYFGKYSGTDAGDDFLIIKEDEILGTVEK